MPAPGYCRIRRPVDQVRRGDNATGNAHAHRPGRGVRHDGAVTPSGEAARTGPVRASRPIASIRMCCSASTEAARAQLKRLAQKV